MPVRGDLGGVLSQHPEERVIEGSGPLVADAERLQQRKHPPRRRCAAAFAQPTSGSIQ